MSLGEVCAPGIVFGSGSGSRSSSRRKVRRLAAIARWAVAAQEIESDEVDAGTLTMSKVRALRQLVADRSVIAEHCDTILCRTSLSDAEVALSISVVVTAINTRVWWKSRNKEI